MGLDQYFNAEKEGEDPLEIGYLRKHNWVEGAMSDLWISRGKPLPDEWDEERKAKHADGEFNCVPLELSLKDINQLMKDIRANKLKPVEGFFFGGGYPDKESRKEELEILKTAKSYLKDGYKIFYSSWW